MVAKYKPKEFRAVSTNSGISLCEKEDGMFLVLRNADDLRKLRELLDKLVIVEIDL